MTTINENSVPWLLSQDDLYQHCRQLLQSPSYNDSVISPFDRHSPAYLMATEFPWLFLSNFDFQCQSTLCIAGSGDVPFFLFHAGAERILAVDISMPACCLNELKRAALRNLTWQEFLTFFLAGLARAESFLARKSLPSILQSSQRRVLYGRIREFLSMSARSFWDDHLSHRNTDSNPFEHFVRHSDLFFLDHILYLRQEEIYEQWREKVRAYPLSNLPMEVALESCDVGFDFIYFSNVMEYTRAHFLLEGNPFEYETYLHRFFQSSVKALNKGGSLCFYCFQSESSPSFDLFEADFEPLVQQGLRLSRHEIRYRSPLLDGSLFRNTLLLFRKE